MDFKSMLIGVLATLLCISLFSFNENEPTEPYGIRTSWIGAATNHGTVWGVELMEEINEKGEVVDFGLMAFPATIETKDVGLGERSNSAEWRMLKKKYGNK